MCLDIVAIGGRRGESFWVIALLSFLPLLRAKLNIFELITRQLWQYALGIAIPAIFSMVLFFLTFWMIWMIGAIPFWIFDFVPEVSFSEVTALPSVRRATCVEKLSGQSSWRACGVLQRTFMTCPCPPNPQCLARRCGGFRLFQQASNLSLSSHEKSGARSQSVNQSISQSVHVSASFSFLWLHVACLFMSQAHSIWPIVYLLLLIHTTPRHGSKSLEICIATLQSTLDFLTWSRHWDHEGFGSGCFSPQSSLRLIGPLSETCEVEYIPHLSARYLTCHGSRRLLTCQDSLDSTPTISSCFGKCHNLSVMSQLRVCPRAKTKTFDYDSCVTAVLLFWAHKCDTCGVQVRKNSNSNNSNISTSNGHNSSRNNNRNIPKIGSSVCVLGEHRNRNGNWQFIR